MRLFAVVVLTLFLNPVYGQGFPSFLPPRIAPASCAKISEVYKAFRTVHAASRDAKLASQITSVEAFFKGMNTEFADQFDKNNLIFTASEMEELLKDISADTNKADMVLKEENCEVYEKSIEHMQSLLAKSVKALEAMLAKPELKATLEARVKAMEEYTPDQFKEMRKQVKVRAKTAEELEQRRIEMMAIQMLRMKKSPLKEMSSNLDEEIYLLARKSIKRMVIKNEQDTVAEVMLKAAMSGADPHSDYMTDREFRQFMDSKQPNFAGLGVIIVEGGRGVYITSIIDGSGTQEGGILKEKDLIVKINGASTAEMDPEEFRSHAIGFENTEVEVEFVRDGKQQKTTVVRRSVSQQTKNITAKMFEVQGKKIGYVQLGNFGMENTATRMREEMSKLGSVDGWILDLRGNPGGLMDMGVDVSALFLGKNKIATWQMTSERAGFDSLKTSRFASTSFEQPMVVLISNTSASASEIVASALQMHGRALVVSASESSFKKGTIQVIAPLPRFKVHVAGGLRVTAGYFYDINGQPIQNRGVKPDIRILFGEEGQDEEEEFSDSKLDHTLPTPSVLPIDPKILEANKISREPMLKDLQEIAPKYDRSFVKRFDLKKDDVVLEAGKEVVSDLIVIDKKKKEEKKAN